MAPPSWNQAAAAKSQMTPYVLDLMACWETAVELRDHGFAWTPDTAQAARDIFHWHAPWNVASLGACGIVNHVDDAEDIRILP